MGLVVLQVPCCGWWRQWRNHIRNTPPRLHRQRLYTSALPPRTQNTPCARTEKTAPGPPLQLSLPGRRNTDTQTHARFLFPFCQAQKVFVKGMQCARAHPMIKETRDTATVSQCLVHRERNTQKIASNLPFGTSVLRHGVCRVAESDGGCNAVKCRRNRTTRVGWVIFHSHCYNGKRGLVFFRCDARPRD